MHKLISTKAALHKAVDHLENLYQGNADASDFSVRSFPHAELSFRIALASAVKRKRPTYVLSESFSPDLVALHMLCLHAAISPSTIAARRLEANEIARLTYASASISASPLYLAMCAPFDIEGIAWDLLALMSAANIQVIVCERRTAENLDGWRAELEFLSKAGSAEVHLLAGHISATSRFIPDLDQMA